MAQINQPMPKASNVGNLTPAVTAAGPASSYVEWGAVWAGGAIAAALSFILLAFGTAIGLSFVAPWNNTVASTTIVASLALFFVMAQQIGTAMAGGYVAGRMRLRWGDATEHEVEFRDGLHGGLVWAVSVILSAALLLSAAGAIARTGTQLAAGAASAASPANPLDYSVDVLLRQAAGPASKPASSSGVIAQEPSGELRSAVLRTVATAIAQGKLDDPDRAYLAQAVARQTGLPEADAEKRVLDVFASASQTVKETADKVRRASILGGFVTAASLLISFGAAWWAAQRGGHHRDNSIPARFVPSGPRRVT